MIVIRGLKKTFGSRVLFENASFELHPGFRYGLTGANGVGKSTLLRILAGDEPASDGVVTTPKDARIGLLRQDQFIDLDRRIVDVAMMGDKEAWRAWDELRSLDSSTSNSSRVSALDELLRARDGYGLEARAGGMLAGLGIDCAVHGSPLGTLSGGYRLRVLLAQCLLSKPDLLLLDEPTNHLDILSIRWLEKYLASYPGCVVMVSHDRRFLDQVATHILDMDYDTIHPYVGNYSQSLAEKSAWRDQREREIARKQRLVAHRQAFIERFGSKATKARQAQSRLKQIRRIEIDELPKSSRARPHFQLHPARQSGNDVLCVEGLSKSYQGRSVLHDVSFLVRRGERVAVIGPNGIGKSTLLRLLVENLQPDTGCIRWGHQVAVGYFPQDHRERLSEPKLSVVDWLWSACPSQSASFVRGELGRLLFSGTDADKPIGNLSGGEAARLLFAKLAVERPNVLVLDEPTNHLDLEAIEALADGLAQFEGTCLMVAHDRWFVSRLATRIIELVPNGHRDFPGTYAEYLRDCGDDHLDVDATWLRAREARAQQQKDQKDAILEVSQNRGDLKRKRNRLKNLPARRDAVLDDIATLEQSIAAIDARFSEPTFFVTVAAEEVQSLRSERHAADEALQRKVTEWEELEREMAELTAELGFEP